jgi:hypothetical protein
MKKQTAMQEMKKWVSEKWSDPGQLISCLEVMNKIEELLPKEKEQIKDAYKQGYKDSEHKVFKPITYYKETYTNAKV